MGRSAKVHKRVKKTTSSSNAQVKSTVSESKLKSSGAPASAAKSSSIDSAKKRADVGADYVTLLSGGRRKAAEEALKLPRE